MSIFDRTKFSLSHKILLFTLLLVFIPSVSIAIFASNMTADIVMEKERNDSLIAIRQIGDQMDFVMRDLDQLSLFMLQENLLRNYLKIENSSENTSNVAEMQIWAQNYLIGLVNSKELVYSININGYNGLILNTAQDIQIMSEEMEKLLIDEKGRGLWYSKQFTSPDGAASFHFLTFSRVYKDINSIEQDLAMLSINVRVQEFTNMLELGTSNKGGELILLDQQQEVITAVRSNQGEASFAEQGVDMSQLSQGTGH